MMMNDYQTFEDILTENDFSTLDKPNTSNIPKDADSKTQLHLYRLAMIEMDKTNWEISKTIASENYSLLEKITEIYINTSNPDREKIRKFLKDIKRWNQVFQHWHPLKNTITENPERYLKLLLANQSMLNGGLDYRDTILMLAPTWHMMEELGIDPEPVFHEVKAWGGDLEIAINNVLNPELRQKNCVKCRTGKPHFVLD